MFPRLLNSDMPVGLEGDFCSGNIHQSVIAGEGQFVVGTGGLTVGRFAWADGTGKVTNAGTGAPTGFVHREMAAVIVAYLGTNSMLIQPGQPCTLMRSGDYWAKTTTLATLGQKVFASNTTGQIATGAAGATIAGFTETLFSVFSAGAVGDLIKISRG